MLSGQGQSAVAPRVLLVDDDQAVLTVLQALLGQAGIECETAASGQEAMQRLLARPFELLLSDVRMPGMSGMELLERVRQAWPAMSVVLLTAHATVPLAVEAIKRGATEFLEKPFNREGLLYVVKKALAIERHASARDAEAPRPRPELQRPQWRSPAMRECEALLSRAARSTTTVLLRGESGTGKEVAARWIHERSPHRSGPFLAVNVAALPDSLLESELFGHEKGAFTGAVSRKAGRVELAAGGTLPLDELGDLPAPLQPKLLRLLQEREYERIGGTQTHRTDVRFIAATHRDLESMVAAGQFRRDLLFRVNVFEIPIPALRERREDIPLLSEYFAGSIGAESGRPGLRFEEAALGRLAALDWPGNVRELRNFVERLVVMTDDDLLDSALVETELHRLHRCSPIATASSAAPLLAGDSASLLSQRRDTEKAAILDALRRTRDNRSQAARVLGIGRRTLYSKLRELGLE